MQEWHKVLCILTLWSVFFYGIIYIHSSPYDFLPSCHRTTFQRRQINNTNTDRLKFGNVSSTNSNLLLERKWNLSDPLRTNADALRDTRCNPVQGVVFLKTHKTGSSTITNILNRFADLNELLVAIPANGVSRFQWPSKFHWTSVDLSRLDGEPANILSNHARYHRFQMDLVVKTGSKYVTILRHPVTQFESSFYYFEYDKLLNLKQSANPLIEFLKEPDQYLHNLTMKDGDLPEAMNLIQSGMLYDLGNDFVEFQNEAAIAEIMKHIETDFDVVMVMEYFDESLVILMREMCWDFDDILYIKLNERSKKRPELPQEVQDRILQWNTGDWTLYQYFNRTLWKKIDSLGESFWKDLREFRWRNSKMLQICSPSEVETFAFKVGVLVKSPVMNGTVDRYHKHFCQKMLMDEIQYLGYFRIKFGQNYGYQKILLREGLKKKTDGKSELTTRLKRLRHSPRFA